MAGPTLMAILGLNTGPFKAAAHDAQHVASHLGNQIKGALAGFMGEEAIRQTIEWGESIFNTAVKLGMTIEEVQRLDYALRLQGTSLLENSKFFEMLSVARDKYSRGAAKPEQVSAFKNFGLTPADAANKDVSFVRAIAESVSAGGMDQDRLMASLKAVGGRGAAAMITAFKMGLVDLMDDAPIVDDETIKRLKEVADEMKDLFIQIKTGMALIVSEITPMFHTLLTGLNVGLIKIFGDLSYAFGGNLTGEQLVAGYMENQVKKDMARTIAMEKALHAGAAGDDPSDPAGEKAREKSKEKFDKEIAKLAKERHDTEQKNYYNSLSLEGKLADAQIRRKNLVAEIARLHKEEDRWNSASDEEKKGAGWISGARNVAELIAQAEVEKAKLDTEFAGLFKKENKKTHHHAADLNSLQRIGGMFVSSPLEMSTLEVARKTEHNTRRLLEHFHGNKTGWHSRNH